MPIIQNLNFFDKLYFNSLKKTNRSCSLVAENPFSIVSSRYCNSCGFINDKIKIPKKNKIGQIFPNLFTTMTQLVTQRRMAMSIFGVGFRKVWLDPTKAQLIAKAKTRT